jgi:hypothetical protein
MISIKTVTRRRPDGLTEHPAEQRPQSPLNLDHVLHEPRHQVGQVVAEEAHRQVEDLAVQDPAEIHGGPEYAQ